MPQSSQPPTTRHELLTALAESELLSAHQFAKADAAIPESVPTAVDAAKRLVEARLLTRFQCERLLAGRSDGFVLGHYVIQEQVGKGSVGRVYRATHRAMNRTVAIKVFSPDVTRSAVARQAFQREVQAAARLNHPNIVTAFDANEVGNRFYLVMEFVDGPTVEALVRKRGPLPWPEACELIRQVAVGLQHAHEQGMVHRDIKPANLLVARASPSMPDCVVKIADFGIAKLSVTPAPVAVPPAPGLTGTPDFVAPEQAYNPQFADHRADLYSLGCVFYFLLAGRPPFPGGTTVEKVRRHQFEVPMPIERVRPDLPPAVAELVARLLEKDPKRRYSTASEMASRLDGLSAGSTAANEEGDRINFELPPVQPGPYSFASSYLSGIHTAPRSGRHPVVSAADGGAETSPWCQLTDEIVHASGTAEMSLEETPFVAPARARTRRIHTHGLPTLLVLTLCGAVVLATLLGLSFLLKLAGK